MTYRRSAWNARPAQQPEVEPPHFQRHFEWPVYGTPHKWVNARRAAGPKSDRLVPMLTSASAATNSVLELAKWYAPLRDRPALFLTFADTPITERGILEFADRFGMLGGSAVVTTDSGLEAEPFAEWANRILFMRQVIALWDLASARDVDQLRDVVVVAGDSVRFQPKLEWVTPDWREPKSSQKVPENPSRAQCDFIEATEPFDVALDEAARERLRRFGRIDVIDWAFRTVAVIADKYLHAALSSRLRISHVSGEGELIQEPDSLGSALWLQFAEAITNQTRFHVCKQCGEWFALPTRGARISREYCSNSCRTRAYRGRQERARELAAKGKSPKDIARELDTTALVVRKWLIVDEGD